MRILIADSGSTKCDWQLLDESGKEIGEFHTMGFNPYFHTAFDHWPTKLSLGEPRSLILDGTKKLPR